MAQKGPSWKERWRRFTISATKLAIAWAWNRLVRRMEQPWRTVKAYYKFLDTVDTVALEQCWEETPVARPLHGLLVDILNMRANRKLGKIQRDRLMGWDKKAVGTRDDVGLPTRYSMVPEEPGVAKDPSWYEQGTWGQA